MRFARRDVRDHIVSCQNDHRPSYWRPRALRQQERLRIDLREIFGLLRFSTFATISATSGRPRLCQKTFLISLTLRMLCRAFSHERQEDIGPFGKKPPKIAPAFIRNVMAAGKEVGGTM